MDNDKLNRPSVLLRTEIKEWWVLKVTEPLERFCVRNRIHPNSITMSATFVCGVCCLLFATGHVLTAGWCILLAGSLDFLDGRVARATEQVTQQGAFLDSVMDRYQDFLLFVGLAVFYRHSWLLYAVLAALGGAFFTSYAASKAENLNVSLSNIGSMQRPERMFLLGFGSMLSSVLQVSLMPFWGKGTPPPQHLLILVILIMAVSTNLTAARRIQYTLSKLEGKP